MNRSLIEPLEARQLLSGTLVPFPAVPFGDAGSSRPVQSAKAVRPFRAVAPRPERVLSAEQVRSIVGNAASQAKPLQVIVVVDREGDVLATYLGAALSAPGADKKTVKDLIKAATSRARTAAYFQSYNDAFTTRTARFIIQDHFPQPVANTPGGPLYGVQFSNLEFSDVNPNVPGISGDPGGIPLYLGRSPVGGIGVAGDGHDVAAREDLLPDNGATTASNPNREFFTGREETDFDERVALAGARGFMAPDAIRATHIFIDGLRLPFSFDRPATGAPRRTLDQLLASNTGTLVGSVVGGTPSRYPKTSFANYPGQLKNPAAPDRFATAGQIVDSNDAAAVKLTTDDVNAVITQAVAQARITRGGIRKPNGVNARVHIAVVDRDGDVLGVFRMDDGTNFSYDVAVQKARTAAFFSDDAHAFSVRAVGFLSQRFFPPGINRGPTGPLYMLQNELSELDPNDDHENPNLHAPLPNGITIFPGGFPLYKNGVLVGAIGVSGDGVDQDDLIAYTGATGYQPSPAIRSDALPKNEITNYMLKKLAYFQTNFKIDFNLFDQAESRLIAGLQDDAIRLPYAKFPRNPLV